MRLEVSRRLMAATTAAALLLAAGCATAPPQPGNLPNAVPRTEPRSGHGNPAFYDVNGQRYKVLASADHFVERGVASWYGPDFHGHNTSSGERYDMYGMTAAHKTLPIPCYARVTNLANGRSIVVRINDRGPFVAHRIVDLSYSAATRLDIVRTGTAFVELRTVGPAANNPVDESPTMPDVSALPMNPVPAALYIQVGAFADSGHAQRIVDRLQSAGVPHVFSLANTAGERVLRRVRVGPIATVEEFDRLATQLATLGFPEARLANE